MCTYVVKQCVVFLWPRYVLDQTVSAVLSCSFYFLLFMFRSNLSISPGLPCKKYCFCRTRPYSMFNTDLNSARREVFKSGLLFENGCVFQKLFPKSDFSEISEKSGYLTDWAVPELVGLYVRYVKIMFCTRV
jgi:hypothetical protein